MEPIDSKEPSFNKELKSLLETLCQEDDVPQKKVNSNIADITTNAKSDKKYPSILNGLMGNNKFDDKKTVEFDVVGTDDLQDEIDIEPKDYGISEDQSTNNWINGHYINKANTIDDIEKEIIDSLTVTIDKKSRSTKKTNPVNEKKKRKGNTKVNEKKKKKKESDSDDLVESFDTKKSNSKKKEEKTESTTYSTSGYIKGLVNKDEIKQKEDEIEKSGKKTKRKLSDNKDKIHSLTSQMKKEEKDFMSRENDISDSLDKLDMSESLDKLILLEMEKDEDQRENIYRSLAEDYVSNSKDNYVDLGTSCSKRYCADFLREAIPELNERSCRRKSECVCLLLKNIFPDGIEDNEDTHVNDADTEQFICREFLNPEEDRQFKKHGILPNNENLCLLCNRLTTTSAYYTLLKRNKNSIYIIQDHHYIVDDDDSGDCYKLDECIYPNPNSKKFYGLVRNFVKFNSSAYIYGSIKVDADHEQRKSIDVKCIIERKRNF